MSGGNISIGWVVKDEKLVEQVRDFRDDFPSKYFTFREKVFSELVALSERYGEVENNE